MTMPRLAASRATDAPIQSESAGIIADATSAGEDIDECLALAAQWGARFPFPGSGGTADRFRMLAAAAEGDLTAARVLEPHADALAIVAEGIASGQVDSRLSPPGGVWGVFAAEAPNLALHARRAGESWLLDGIKPWCSLAGRLDGALVTAHCDDQRGLFLVDLHDVGVLPQRGTWISRGLRNVDSGPVHFDGVPAIAVGEPGWYLERPGFAWGGIGVAACWYGAAAALVRSLAEVLRGRSSVDRIMALHLGAADAALHAARSCLDVAAQHIDSGRADGSAGTLLAARTRAVVAESAEAVLRHVGHARGPAPLTFEETHARRVADLQIYLRQHHGERDLAELGSLALVDSPMEIR